jgi:hypothetical protein
VYFVCLFGQLILSIIFPFSWFSFIFVFHSLFALQFLTTGFCATLATYLFLAKATEDSAPTYDYTSFNDSTTVNGSDSMTDNSEKTDAIIVRILSALFLAVVKLLRSESSGHRLCLYSGQLGPFHLVVLY